MRHPHPESDFWLRPDETTVYLIHLFRPIYHAQHYIGSCLDLDRRLQEHRRKYPLYFFTEASLDTLSGQVPSDVLAGIQNLIGVKFRRRHTFVNALTKQIGTSELATYQKTLFQAARRHTTNGLIMKANREGILWTVAKTWNATREFEFWLKRQKKSREFCPICCGVEEAAPF